MANRITESVIEDAALEWFEGLGYVTLHGPYIAPDGDAPERAAYDAVVLESRLRESTSVPTGRRDPANVERRPQCRLALDTPRPDVGMSEPCL